MRAYILTAKGWCSLGCISNSLHISISSLCSPALEKIPCLPRQKSPLTLLNCNGLDMFHVSWCFFFSFMFDSLCICFFERLEAFSRPRLLECKVMTLANVSKLMSAATVSTMCLVSLALSFLSLSEHDSITVTQVSSSVCHCMGCHLPDIVFEAATCCNNESVQGMMRWPTNLWSACVGTGLARVACLAMVVKLTRNKNLHVEEGSKPLRCTENQKHFSPAVQLSELPGTRAKWSQSCTNDRKHFASSLTSKRGERDSNPGKSEVIFLQTGNQLQSQWTRRPFSALFISLLPSNSALFG